jgi:predicted phosphodiesterase
MVLGYVIGPLSDLLTSSSTRSTGPTASLPTATSRPATVTPADTPPPPTPSPAPSPKPTATPRPTPLALDLGEKFTFAVCGDSRDGDDIYRRVLDEVQRDGSQFLVHLGDIVSNGLEKEWLSWQQMMAGFALPFFPVPGNHDSHDGLLEEYLQYSGAPAQRYSLDVGSVHLSLLDSYSGALFPSTLEWLQEDLASTEQPVKMVFFHHPPFDPDGTDHILQMGNSEVMALAERYGVQYVFTGHIHAYAEEERDGVQYIISGGCGGPLYAGEHPEGGFTHYVRVHVDGADVRTEVVRIDS